MISVIEFKKYVAGIGILDIIIDKICNRKKLYLIILLKVEKNLEVDFYHIILPLSLAVCLWVKGGRKSLFNVEKII